MECSNIVAEDPTSQGGPMSRDAKDDECAAMLACQGWKCPEPPSPKDTFHANFGEHLTCKKICSLPI